MSTTPSLEQVQSVYAARGAKIQEAKKELQALEEKQVLAEKFILDHNPGVEAIAAIYVSRRNEASALEKQQKEIKERQTQFEEWFAKRMKEVGTDAFKTAAGTIYSYRSESVTMGEWDSFVDQVLLAPAITALAPHLPELSAEELVKILKESIPLYFLNKAVAKTAVLDEMGEVDEKTKGRPNPPPVGINYRAEQKVGVRKS